VPVGRSLLFFGCRRPDSDLLYADELRRYEELDVVRVENAFSRADSRCRYVQDALLDRADEVWDLLRQDAVVMVCGNAGTMAPATRSVLQQIFRERTGTSESDAAAWLAGLRAADRFLEDIWGG
jgi:cytochrome P450/NADPH-cytochrome P450 reductase